MKIKKQQLKHIYEVLDKENISYLQETMSEWFPKLFKETKSLTGWHKWIGNNKAIGFISKEPTSDCYVFDYLTNDDTNDYDSLHKSYLIPATDKEVEDALIKEAKKRGFKRGVAFTNSPFLDCLKSEVYTLCNEVSNRGYKYDYGKLYFDEWTLFSNGKWATIIETITKEQAEKELGKTIVD